MSAPTAPERTHQPLWIGALGLVALPFMLRAVGLTLDTATVVVILALAALGLNVLVGYTGLTSFGHSAWFGIGGYAAALSQKHWLAGQVVLPFLFSIVCTALLATVVGFLILRRRGVYFSLLTLALAALTFAIAFRWTAFTGGEGGLGGIERYQLGPLDLDDHRVFYVITALMALAVLYALWRVVRSPFGHVLVAIRENEQRASFQGYDTNTYKLAAFVLSAVVTGLAGALLVFHHRLAAADSTSVVFSGELLAMVVIGGMRSFLGPALGALFFILFRELFSIWTDNWLLWFGLIFVGFILFSPTGLTGVVAQIRRRLRPAAETGAAMDNRKIHAGMALPDFLRPDGSSGAVLEIKNIDKRFGGIRAVNSVSLTVLAGQVHALIGPNGAGKTTLVNVLTGFQPPTSGGVMLDGVATSAMSAHQVRRRGVARTFQSGRLFRDLSVLDNLAVTAVGLGLGRREAAAKAAAMLEWIGIGALAEHGAGALPYTDERRVAIGRALMQKPAYLLLDEPAAGMSRGEAADLASLIRRIVTEFDCGVLLIEHNIGLVLDVCDHIEVLDSGEIIEAGAPSLIRSSEAVRHAYMGTQVDVEVADVEEAIL